LAGPRSPLLETFAGWLTAFGDAWEATDAHRLAALFALGASMQPDPFAELIRGRRQIAHHWAGELEAMRDVHFAAQVLGAGDTYGVAHFRVTFAASERRAAGVRDGVLVAALDARGLCTSLRMWWHESGAGE